VPLRALAPYLGPGVQAFAKLENRQLMGSFKPRGALSRLSAPDAADAAAILCAGAGNMGLAVAWAARALNLRALVACYDQMPSVKRAHIASLAALTLPLPPSADLDHAERYTQALAAARPQTLYLPRSPDLATLTGYATIAREVMEDLPQCDGIICPVGRGGLARGLRLWLAERYPRLPIIGVQSADNAAMALSWARGQALEALPAQPSLADELSGGLRAEDCDGARAALSDLLTVSEGSISQAMAALLTQLGEVVEGAGAAPVALALEGRIPPTLRRPCLILTGRNVDRDLLDAQLGPPRAAPPVQR
jgi:threonine dehydratase